MEIYFNQVLLALISNNLSFKLDKHLTVFSSDKRPIINVDYIKTTDQNYSLLYSNIMEYGAEKPLELSDEFKTILVDLVYFCDVNNLTLYHNQSPNTYNKTPIFSVKCDNGDVVLNKFSITKSSIHLLKLLQRVTNYYRDLNSK